MGDFSEELDSHWDFNDPAASEQRFQNAAEGRRRAEALTQIARAVGLQKRFDEALRILDEAASIGGGPIVDARVALERGRILRDSGGDPLQEFQRALDICLANEFDFYAVDAMHMLAICARGAEAITLNEKAITLAANSQSTRAQQWEASLLNNLGWSHFDLGDYTDALRCFERAVPLREHRGQIKEASLARWCVARALRALGRIDEALEIQYGLLETDDTGFAHEEAGECLLASGCPEAAKPHFAEAAKRLTGSVDEDRLQRLEDLGRGSTFGQISKKAVRFVRSPRANRKAIWKMVATSAGLSQWLGCVDGDIEAPGNEFSVRIDDDPSDEAKCRVMDYLTPRTFTLAWDIDRTANSILSFEVAENRLEILRLTALLGTARST
jgi:tetratricopeptide (TPR) repeat protein